MDTILELLSGLASAFSPTEFITVLGVIGLLSLGAIIFFIKNVRKKSGLWSFLNAPEEEMVEIKDVLSAVGALAATSEKKYDEILAAHKEVLINVLAVRDEHRDRASVVIGYLEQIKNLEGLLADAKEELTRHIDELRRQFTIHDLHDQQLYESLKSTLTNSLQVISRINTQVEKIDEYARTAVPEFKLAHKELSKDVNNLSRDIALVERSLQSQINNVTAVKLR
jgi:hypothetical protein